MQPNPRLKNVYDFLRTQNVKNFPKSYGEFESKMGSDQSLSGNVYNYLKSHNVKNLPDTYESFYESVGLKKKEPAGQDLSSPGPSGGESSLPNQGATVSLTPEQQEAFRNLRKPKESNLFSEKQEQLLKERTVGKSTEGFVPNLVEDVSQIPPSFNRGVISAATAIPKTAGIIGKQLDELIGDDRPLESYPTYQAGKWLEDKALEVGITATDPDREGFMNSTIPQAFGQVVGMLLTGGGSSSVAKGGSVKELAKTLTSAPAVTGALQVAVPEYEAAKAAGMDDDEAFGVFMKNIPGGLTEVVPIMNGLSRINKITGGGIVSTFKNLSVNGLEEAVQETVQQYYSNVIADESYDPGRDPMNGVLEGAGAGFFVGFVLPGLMGAMQNAKPSQKAMVREYLNQKLKDIKEQPIQTDEVQGDVGKAFQETVESPVEKQVENDNKITPEEDIAIENSSEQAESIGESQDNVIKQGQKDGENALVFITSSNEKVYGERLTKALNKVADDWAENARAIREEDAYADHVSEQEKDNALSDGLEYAEKIRRGERNNNLTIAQRINLELTGEEVPILPARKNVENISSDPKLTSANEVSESISKFGWTSTESESGIDLFNAKGKKVATITETKKGYVIKDTSGAKLLSGKGQIGKSAEKVAKEYFYAKEQPIQDAEITEPTTAESAENISQEPNNPELSAQEPITQEQDVQETVQTETKDDTLPQSEEVEFDWLGTTKKGKIISEEDGKYKIKGTDGTIFRVKKSDIKNGSDLPNQTQQQPSKPKTKKRVITQAQQEKPSDSRVNKEVGEGVGFTEAAIANRDYRTTQPIGFSEIDWSKGDKAIYDKKTNSVTPYTEEITTDKGIRLIRRYTGGGFGAKSESVTDTIELPDGDFIERTKYRSGKRDDISFSTGREMFDLGLVESTRYGFEMNERKVNEFFKKKFNEVSTLIPNTKQSVESLSQDLDTIVGKQKEATKKDPKIIAANLNPLLIAKAAWTGLNKAQNLTFGKFAKKTEDWVSKKVKKGVSSKNYALRNTSNSLQSLLGGLAYEHGDLKNKLNYMGNKNYAHLKAKMLAEDMYKIIDSDPASLSRLQAVLDPETSVGTEQEGLSYDDLNDTEKSLHDIIRKTNDFVHDWHFKEGLIDKETYNKNKGSYIARLYEDFELIDPEVEAAFKSSRADFNMFKQRKDFEDVHAKIMRDPVYATAKRVSQMLQNQAMFDYAKAISNSDIKVSDEEFPGSQKLGQSGKPYYGELTGKYVPSHIAQDFKGFSFANKAMQYLYEGARKYDKWAFRQFLKRSKTVYNPLVRTGNILSNFSFSFAAGIDPFTFFLNRFEAKKQIKAKSENYQDLVKAGLIGTDAFTSDITPLKVKDNPKSIIGKAGNVINKAGNWAAETYGKADDVAKLSAYISFLQDGYSKQDAIEQVYEGFQNYATVGKAFDFGSKLPVVGNPFIKFKADLMRIIKNSVTRRPLTTMAYLGGIVGLQSMFSDWSDEDDEIKKIRERRNFIPKIKTPFGDIPLVFQTPFGEINVARYMSPYYIYDKGDNGDIVNDITEWLPIQFERTRDSAFPIKPEMSDVFLGTYAQILFDTDFRGMSILDPDATPFTGGIATTEEKIANALNYIARSQIPMFRSSQDMISAYNGEADYYGRERDMTQALLNNIIKIQEFGEEQARETLTKEIKYKMGKFESLSRDVSQLKSVSKKKISKILGSETMPQETKSRLIQEEAEALNKRILVKLQEQAEITKELNEPAKLLKSLD